MVLRRDGPSLPATWMRAARSARNVLGSVEGAVLIGVSFESRRSGAGRVLGREGDNRTVQSLTDDEWPSRPGAGGRPRPDVNAAPPWRAGPRRARADA
jgi:hypothetical protein